MPRFLAPITVAQEYVTSNETISGSETILGATSGKDSYWTTVNVASGLHADTANFNNLSINDNISANWVYLGNGGTGGISFDLYGDNQIYSGMGFHIQAKNGVSIDMSDTIDGLYTVNKSWYFSNDGSLVSPNIPTYARSWYHIELFPAEDTGFGLTTPDGVTHNFAYDYDNVCAAEFPIQLRPVIDNTLSAAIIATVDAINASSLFDSHYDEQSGYIWIYQKSTGPSGNQINTNFSINGISDFTGGEGSSIKFNDGTTQITAFTGIPTNIVFDSVSATSLSGTYYGDGTNLTGLGNYLSASGGTINGDLTVTGTFSTVNTDNWNSTYTTVCANSAQWSITIDNTKLPLSGGSLTNGLTGITGLFTTSLSAPSLSGTYYGNGGYLTNLNASNITSGTLSASRLPVFNGDISTTLNSSVSTTVIKIQGQPISTATPVNGQMLQYNGVAWVPANVPVGGSGGGGLVYFFNAALSAQLPTTNLPLTAHQLGRVALSGQTILTVNNLSQVDYSLVGGYVTDVLDPNVTYLPAGIFDFNIWGYSNANTNNPTLLQALIYTYDGVTTPTLISTSEDAVLSDGGIFAEILISCLIPQTTVLSSTRIYVEFRAKASAGNKSMTLGFGGITPTHVHTSIPSVGGSGLVKTVNGVLQTPASLLVDVDVASNAAIAQSKISGLTSSLAGKVNTTDIIPISSGGTGSTSAAAALAALGGFPIAGGTLGDGLTATSGTFTSYLSSPSISGTYYGDASNLTNIGLSIGLPHYFIKSRSTSGTNRVGVMNTGATPNTFTFSTTGALLSADYNNYLPATGDVVLFLNQTTQTQNGPWAVTDTGSPSTSALLTRPSWFSGTVKPGMLLSETRGLNHSGIWSLYNNTVALSTDFVVGQSTVLFITAVTKAQSNAVVASNTFTGTQTLAVGTTALAPLKFQNGTLLTTPTSGSVEWDGNNMYVTDLSANRKQVMTNSDVPVFEVDGRITQLTGSLSGNTFTNSVTGALSAVDTYAFSAGDSLVWYFTGTNAGLWTVTSTGSPTTSAVLTRPSYYQGTLPWSLALVGFKKGTAQGTWIQLRPNTIGTYPVVVNSTSMAAFTTINPTGNASISGNTFTNTQTMVAGSTTIAPLKFQSGVLQITPTAHSLEWDGTSLYATNSAASRKPLLYSDFSNVSSGPVNLLDGLNAGAATFTVSVSSPSISGVYYGDGSKLTGITANASDSTKLPLSGGTLTGGLTGTTGTFTISVSSPSISGVYYGDGSKLTGITSTASDSTKLPLSGGTLTGGLTGTTGVFTTSLSAPSLSGVFYGDGSKLTGIALPSGIYLPLSGGDLTGVVTSVSTISSANTITANNIATQNQVQYLSSGAVKVYQYYNPVTNSLDTVFN